MMTFVEAMTELCSYCKHRWGKHAISGCKEKDCDCDYDGIKAIRNLMSSED